MRQFVNIIMLVRVLGLLLCIEAAFMLIPLVSAILFSDGCVVDFIISITITALCGFLMMRIEPKSRDMGRREAILLTALIWVIMSVFGMIPFLLSGSHVSVTDAFFESINGFTTTGASMFATLHDVPKSILMWRSVQQWIGGMGIILFTLAIVPMLNNTGGMFLFNAEVTGITHDKLRPRISSTAKGLWLVYIVLTLLLIVLLWCSNMTLFEAICHGLSTMSTGGFSTVDMGYVSWNSLYVKIVMMVFMLLGGINFSLLFKAVTGANLRKLFVENTALKAYIFFIFASAILLAVNKLLQGGWHSIDELTLSPIFLAISTISSTGVSEPGYLDTGPLAEIVLVIMMFTGACAGSTSGGAKIDRVVILFKFIKNEFFKMMNPNNVTTVTINGRGTRYIMVQKVLGFLCLYVMVIIAGAALLGLSGLTLKESFFFALSAISNTGIGSDVVGFGGGYMVIPDVAKWILCGIMLIGRLELYTILLLFTPYFWRK